jgi:filamentous hemagglutinin
LSGPALKGNVEIWQSPLASETDIVAERQALARNFYETNTNWDAARIDSHLSGIDFTKPVDVVNIPEGSQLSQWNFPGGRVGNYFTDVGNGPGGLGVYTNGRVESVFQFNSSATALRSTAANISDTFSVPGLSIEAPGGGTQYFIPSH